MMVKKNRATPWKPGKVISICLRNGVYVLAQMVRDPYLVFFNHFNEENNWEGVTLKEEDILFCKAVTRQFLRYSSVAIVKEVTPLLEIVGKIQKKPFKIRLFRYFSIFW